MKTLAKVGVVACITMASVTPAASHAGVATTAPQRAAATEGFVPVGTVAFDATAIASPSDGIAYVGGRDKDDTVRLQQYTRTSTGVQVRDVPVPAIDKEQYGQVRLAAAGGRTYLAVGSLLFAVSPSGLRAIALPTVPRWDGKPTTMKPETLVADGPRSLWASWGGYYPNAPRRVAHWDGTSWTQSTQYKGWYAWVGDGYAKGGHYFEFLNSFSTSRTSWLTEWDGAKWEVLRAWSPAVTTPDETYGSALTFAGMGDITIWGQTRPPMVGGPSKARYRGSCERFVDDKVSDCPAPPWGVMEAVRLLDGRVVLGGMDGTDYTGRVQGGFAVVPRTGAVPVIVPGDPGDLTLGLAAATQGSTVWALTRAGDTKTVQVMGH